jgi:hypothetical protein
MSKVASALDQVPSTPSIKRASKKPVTKRRRYPPSALAGQNQGSDVVRFGAIVDTASDMHLRDVRKPSQSGLWVLPRVVNWFLGEDE